MKVELQLSQRRDNHESTQTIIYGAIVITLTEEQNAYLRTLLRHDEVSISAISLVPSDTEYYVHVD